MEQEKPGKLSLYALLVFLGTVFGWFAYQPWSVAHKLQEAGKAGNATEMSKYIDYDRLAANLKRDLRAAFDEQVAARGHTPEAQFSAALASMFIEPMVDTMISPAGLSHLLSAGKTTDATANANDSNPDSPPADAAAEEPTASAVETSMRYTGLNTFAITVHRADDPDTKLTFLLTRYDLTDWKLSELQLPHPPEMPTSETPPGFGETDVTQDVQDGAQTAGSYDTRYDLPVADDYEQTSEQTPVQSSEQFDGDCVDMRVAQYRAENGGDADIPPSLLAAWTSDCNSN